MSNKNSATYLENGLEKGVEVKNTTCYMCACRCGIRVTLRDGEIRYIQGNPDHPLNKGVICAKGSSGIMKQYSPARLTKPLKRREGADRGAADFEVISWDEAFQIMEDRLRHLRETDPKKFALFTGRDQMQALTGMFAKNFGTPNYAAHGGFFSVNMAAAMIYTIGGSFWEFGGPDLERSKLFFMFGTAEDHHSNPLKIELSKFKRNGGRFVSINPVRSGYSAIADEWVPIKPGTDGALILALIHEIIKTGLYDREFLIQYSNAAQLVNLDEDSDDFGLLMRGEEFDEGKVHPHDELWWDRNLDKAVQTHSEDADPRLMGEFTLEDGTPVKPGFQLLVERVKDYTPEWAADITGIPVDIIRRLAHEMGITARDEKIELPIAARPGCPLQRLPDYSRPVDPDVHFGHHRPPRRLPPQGAVPTPHPTLPQNAKRPAGCETQYPARWHAARLARRPQRPVRGRRRQAGAHRQGLFLGIPTVGTRPDAQRHHQCLARRSLQDRYVNDLHGQHGLEFHHEYGGSAQDAQ